MKFVVVNKSTSKEENSVTPVPFQVCQLINQKERCFSDKSLVKDKSEQDLRPFTKHISSENKTKADLRHVLQLLTAKIAVKHKSHHQLYNVMQSVPETEEECITTNIYQPSKRRQILSLNEQQLPKKTDFSIANYSSEIVPDKMTRKLKVRIKNKTVSNELMPTIDKENEPPNQDLKGRPSRAPQHPNLGITFSELLKNKNNELSVGSIGSYLGSPVLMKSNKSVKSSSHSSRPTAAFTEIKEHSQGSRSPAARGEPVRVAKLLKNGSPRHVPLSSGYCSFDNYFETQSKGT